MLYRVLTTWLLLVFLTTSCSSTPLHVRAEIYNSERTEFENRCLATKPIPNECLMPFYLQRFHKRWNETLGSVPASEALWAEHDRMAREWAREFVKFHEEGTPMSPGDKWKNWSSDTEERFALDIAQQLAGREAEAAARQEQAVAALTALGLIAIGVTGALAHSRMEPYRPILSEICTYPLRALQGQMLCVDSLGIVRAR